MAQRIYVLRELNKESAIYNMADFVDWQMSIFLSVAFLFLNSIFLKKDTGLGT